MVSKLKIVMVFWAFFMPKIILCQAFDLQGHRGCRGLMPENSIPGFLKAVALGVTTLEMDVAISADGKVVVTHDLFISPEICVNEIGLDIKKDKKILIYDLDYEDIKAFDCGIKGNDRFPEQQKVSVYKPLLQEVIDTVEQFVNIRHLSPVQYNIELKSIPGKDDISQPSPGVFTDLVYEVMKDRLPATRVIIQSFDSRILVFWKSKFPTYRLSFLTSSSQAPARQLQILGFAPDIYSPNYRTISAADVKALHDDNIAVIPWTVNDIKSMKKMINYGVDGLITDYPSRYLEIAPATK